MTTLEQKRRTGLLEIGGHTGLVQCEEHFAHKLAGLEVNRMNRQQKKILIQEALGVLDANGIHVGSTVVIPVDDAPTTVVVGKYNEATGTFALKGCHEKPRISATFLSKTAVLVEGE